MSRFRLASLILAIVGLRIAIGFHFFYEGASKLKKGDFDAAGFLAAARGPFAPVFHGMLDDPTGAKVLAVKNPINTDPANIEVDPTLTLALWDDFVDRATAHYQFGSEDLTSQIRARVRQLEDDMLRTSTESTQSDRISEQLAIDRANITAVAEQRKNAGRILESHRAQFLAWIDDHRVEIETHFATADRLSGFRRDGANASSAAMEVASLRGQIDQIRADRNSRMISWRNEVVAFWDSLESQINGLAVDVQRSKSPVAAHRPFDQPHSKIKWINRVIPWLDALVGACLVLGLFTRTASIVGAVFLLSIALSQPFWILGTSPTHNQIVELMGLLVVAGIGAGRYGGLDYFIQAFFRRWRNGSKRDDSPQS